MKKFTLSLRTRLLILVLLALLPAMILNLITGSQQRQAAARAAQNSATQFVTQLVDEQQEVVDSTRRTMGFLAQLPAVTGLDRVRCQPVLGRWEQDVYHYTRLYVADRNGTLLCDSQRSSQAINPAYRPWFRQVIESDQFTVGDYEFADGASQPTLSFGYPVHDAANQVKAVLAASLDLSWLTEFLDHHVLPNGAELTIFDRSSVILSRVPDAETWVGHIYPDAQVFRLVVSENRMMTTKAKSADGITKLYTAAPLYQGERPSLYVSLAIPSTVAYAEANRLLYGNLIGLALVGILALATAWFSGQWFILRPITRLMAATRHLANGDLSARTVIEPNGGEIGQLTASFNQMAEALQEQMTERERVAQELSAREQYLSLLNRLTRNAIEMRNLPELLQILADDLSRLYQADDCYITLWDEAHQWTIPIAAHGENRDIFPSMPAESNDLTMTASVLAAEHPLAVDDVYHTAYISNTVAARFPMKSMLGLPLIADGQKLGAAIVVFREPHTFTPQEIAQGGQVADQVALAITKSRAIEAAQRRAQEAEIMRQAGAALASALDFNQILEVILNLLENVVPYDSACMFLREQDRLRIVAARGFSEQEQWVGREIPFEQSLLMVSQYEGKAIILDNAQNDPRFQDWGNLSHVRGWMSVPIFEHGETIGFLTLDSRREAAFDEEQAAQAQAFANQAAIAIQNARLYQSARTAVERHQALYDVSQIIAAASLDLEHIYNAIHKAIHRLMPSDAFVIALLDETRQYLDVAYLADEEGRYNTTRLPATTGISGRVVQSGQALYIDDFFKINVDSVHVGSPTRARSILAVPLSLRQETIGVISVQSYQPNAFSSQDQTLLQMLAAHIAIAIDNARLFKTVQQLAITDSVTHSYNIRGLMEVGRREIDRARRFDRPLSAIFIDIDHFKQLNDTYGHAVGNEVLACVASRLRDSIRDVDVFARYGGEEFVVLLPETDSDAAYLIAERLRLCIADDPITTSRGALVVAISLGVSTLSNTINTLSVLLDCADSAMYAAKRSGRNRVIVHTEAIDAAQEDVYE